MLWSTALIFMISSGTTADVFIFWQTLAEKQLCSLLDKQINVLCCVKSNNLWRMKHGKMQRCIAIPQWLHELKANNQIQPTNLQFDHTLCWPDDECPLYWVGFRKSILLKLKQYRVVLIWAAKSEREGFDRTLPDSSEPSNDTLSILALHW